ncbi:MAG: DUF6701 domain-containing protein [Pseudomonadales bacterium]
MDGSSSASSGTLTDSGGSGSSYQNNESCGFRIDSSGGDITLSFSSFDYEDSYDFVLVYDGTSTSGALLGSFTGTSIPADVTASSGAMYVVSSTDFSVRESGFVAAWSVASAASENAVCRVSGSRTDSGTLTDSGGSSGSYSDNENCGFLIQPSDPGDITLSFSAFSYENTYDFVRVYDGTSSAGTLLGSFTGSSLPPDLIASSGAMYVVSDTDGSVQASGFVADWSTAEPAACPGETVGDNFPSVSYSTNSGSQNWTTDWLEIGESDGVSSGISRVNSSLCTAGNCLRIGEPSSTRTWSNRGAQRELNLAGSSGATLSFNYLSGRNRGTMSVALAVSDDGGSTWTTLRTYAINSSDFTANPQSFDISAYAAANTRIRFLSSGNSAVIGMYIDDINIRYQPSCASEPAAEWRFDEIDWSGAADEVTDSSGNNLDGTAEGSVDTTSAGQICRAGSFDGVDDRIDVDGLPPLLHGTATLSYWQMTTATGDSRPWVSPGLTGIEESGGGDDVFWGWIDGSGQVSVGAGNSSKAFSSTPINDGVWHHIVLTRDADSGEVKVYVDGALEDTAIGDTGVIGNTFNGLGHIANTRGRGRFLPAIVDEVLVFADVLTDTAVQDIYTNQRNQLNYDGTQRDCPRSSVTGFKLQHDQSGIFCLAEPVTVAAVDPSDVVVPTYAGLVTLDSQSGRGSWSLASGNGTLTDAVADDGLATYEFAGADNGQAQFLLSYPEGASALDVDVFEQADNNVRDDDAEGTLTFAPSGFTVTGSSLSNPPPAVINDPIATEVAGNTFSIYVSAYGTTPTDPDCGVIESYQGDLAIKPWLERNDPVSGTRTVTVDGTAIGVGESSAAAQSVQFVGGQAQLAIRYKDAGNIGLQFKDDATYSHTLRGGSNNFVVRPDSLVISEVATSAGDPNPGAVNMAGAGFIASGANFRVTVQAVDTDGDVTANFGLESSPELVSVSSTGLVAPVGGRHGSSGDVSGGNTLARVSAGTFQSTTVAFDEVGIIRLQPALRDGDYLGTGSIPVSVSGNVGRFYPADINMVSGSTVAPCSGFGYFDQPALQLNYTLQARNTLGALVENYDTALIGSANVAAIQRVAENANNGSELSSRLSAGTASWSAGVLVETDVSASFSRLAAPDGPFDTLQIGLKLSDPLDSLNLASPDMLATAAGDCIGAGSCDARALGAPLMLRYGRMAVLPGTASELENLDVPLLAQYFDGAGFRPQTADQCSLYQLGDATLSDYQMSLNAGETSATGPLGATALVAGRDSDSAPLLLSAPGAGNAGSVLLQLATPAWLQFDWTGAGASDPAARMHFGLFRGHDRVVFWGERMD